MTLKTVHCHRRPLQPFLFLQSQLSNSRFSPRGKVRKRKIKGYRSYRVRYQYSDDVTGARTVPCIFVGYSETMALKTAHRHRRHLQLFLFILSPGHLTLTLPSCRQELSAFNAYHSKRWQARLVGTERGHCVAARMCTLSGRNRRRCIVKHLSCHIWIFLPCQVTEQLFVARFGVGKGCFGSAYWWRL